MRRTILAAFLLCVCATPDAMSQGVYCGNGVWGDQCGANSHVLVSNKKDGVPCAQSSVIITPSAAIQGAWNISVAACGDAGGAPRVSVFAGNNGPPNIDTITIDCPAGFDTELAFVGPFDGVELRVRNIRAMQRTGAGRLLVSGPILGDLGEAPGMVAIEADALHGSGFVGFEIRGDMKGRINLRGPGDLDFLQVDALSVFGNMEDGIDARGGSIRSITVGDQDLLTGGRIGLLTFTPNIRAWGHINSVVGGEINANIRAGHTFDALDPASHSNIAAVIVDPLLGNGRFTGEISAERIARLPSPPFGEVPQPAFYQVNVGGDFGAAGHPAHISLGDFLTNYQEGITPTDNDNAVRRIVIGHSFVSGSTIVLPRLDLPGQPGVASNGARGQVLINQRSDPQNPGVWEPGAQVVAGNVTISGPTYSAGHNALGGGSVGVAPFGLHGTDCVPPNGGTVILHAAPGVIWSGEDDPPCEFLRQHVQGTITRCWVQLRGPVAAASGAPVKIERRPLGASAWTDVTSEFAATILTDIDPVFPGNARSHRIFIEKQNTEPPEFGVDVEYRITRGANLRCVDVANTPLAAEFEYTFKVYFDCRGTLLEGYYQNDDGVLDGWDMVEWLHEPEDLNGDNATDENDIWVLFQVIEEYTSAP